MPQLDHLPEEILSDIVHLIMRGTLPDVAATCRLFFRIVIPQLYYVVPDESVIGRGQVATCDVLYKQSDIAARALKYLRLSILC